MAGLLLSRLSTSSVRRHHGHGVGVSHTVLQWQCYSASALTVWRVATRAAGVDQSAAGSRSPADASRSLSQRKRKGVPRGSDRGPEARNR